MNNTIQSMVVYDKYNKIPLSEFTAELEFEFSELTSEALPYYVLKAIRRLATVGNILRRSVYIHTQECVEHYIIDPPDCVDIIAIMNICNVCNNCCGKVLRLTQQPCSLSCGTLSWYESPNIIYLTPAKSNNIYKVDIAVAPSMDACDVDNILYTNFFDIIINGTKYYIYSMAGKPWSSVNRAQEYKQDFERGIRSAALDVLMGGQRGSIKGKFPKSV